MSDLKKQNNEDNSERTHMSDFLKDLFLFFLPPAAILLILLLLF